MKNSDEQHRKSCEAREVMKWPRERRESHYEGVKTKRGQKAVDDLIAEVKKQYLLQEKTAGISL